MSGSLQGRSTGAWARVPLAAARCLLSPISPVFPLQVLYNWSGAQREKLGCHLQTLGQSESHTEPAQPLLTWKKVALVRGTRMSWEPPVGTGSRAEGRIWGQS